MIFYDFQTQSEDRLVFAFIIGSCGNGKSCKQQRRK
jgi:hypothetical protein